MPNVHASNGLTASGAHRWLACTPSAQLELKFPATSSSYAEEGTHAHSVAELTTRYWLGFIKEDEYENELNKLKKSEYYNAEMQECAVAYAKFVLARLEEAKKVCPDPVVILETKLDFSKYVPQGFGTGDCVIISEPTLEVIDFKYGKGVRVEAEDNPQMMLYGLGALEQYGDLYDIKDIRMNIFQPRLSGESSYCEKTVKDLTTWAKKVVVPAARLAAKGEGDFNPSEETCKFCRAKHCCRARADKNLELFDNGPDPLLITPDEAGSILEKAKDIESWLADLKTYVTTTITNGGEVKGWKMVEGRSNRKITDTDLAAQAFIKAGYEEALLYERKFATLTQLESAFGKKAVAEVLGELIAKPKGSPTLAPESDKRAPYNFEDQILKAFDEGGETDD